MPTLHTRGENGTSVHTYYSGTILLRFERNRWRVENRRKRRVHYLLFTRTVRMKCRTWKWLLRGSTTRGQYHSLKFITGISSLTVKNESGHFQEFDVFNINIPTKLNLHVDFQFACPPTFRRNSPFPFSQESPQQPGETKETKGGRNRKRSERRR